MGEEGQKYMVAYCASDRYTENRDRQFVLNPSLHWKPVECSEQCCCTCMPGLMEDKSGCKILYALKLIQFVVRDTSKKRTKAKLTHGTEDVQEIH